MVRDQDGRAFEFKSLAGKVMLVSFIYTRCPSPTMCPLITRKFVRVQKELANLRDSVRFVLITMDPDYDTPRVLREYGEVSGIDFTNFSLLTGEGEDLRRLERTFQVYKKEEQPGVLAHTTDAFLIDAKGDVKRVFPGAFWEVDDVVEAMSDLLGAGKPGEEASPGKVER